jgi:ribose transport system substrate-binding protein
MTYSVSRWNTLLCSMAFAVLLAGCSSQEGSGGKTAGTQGKKLVVFSQCNNSEPYRAAQNARMKELWGKHDDVELVIDDAQQDNSKQISQIETAILKGPALLIVAPNEREPLTAVMGQAMAAGIPTICLERDIIEPNYTTYVRADNRAIGKLAGEFIVDYLTRKNGKPAGNVVQICGLKGVEGEINRYEGAMEVLSKHPDIKIVAEPVADWLQSRARERMAEVLATNDKIDVVYGHNDPMAVGAYLAAKEAGREKEMIFIGVDGLRGEAGGIEQVRDGVLAATFIYPLCVDKAVEVGEKIIHDSGFKPEKEYTLESEVVTLEKAAKLLDASANAE